MDRHAKPLTAQDHEIRLLKQTIDQLENENYHIKEYMIDQQKKLDSLQNRTGWAKFNDSLLTLGEHRIDDAIYQLQKQRHLYKHDVKRDPGIQSEATGRRRSTTLPSSRTQTEIKKQRRTLRRVDSVAALAGRLTSLFKKNKKNRDKETVRDEVILEGGGESVEDGIVERAKSTVMKEWEEREKLEQEHVQRLVEEQKIPWAKDKPAWAEKMAEHEQAAGWKLEKAQDEYKKSLEKESSAYPVRKDSIKVVKGHQNETKDSKKVEEELVIAMEKEYLDNFPSRGTIRTVHWPEGTRITGSIFEAPQVSPLPIIPTWTALEHTISTHQLPHPPPAPTHPPPAIPHKSRPRKTHLAPAPPGQSTDDIFFFSRPATPASQATPAAENPRIQRLRHRRSAPSPTPRFVTHRPPSPSPGGNDPMPPNPVPSWLRTRKEGD